MTTQQLNGTGLTLSLTVRDIDASVSWYHDIVGFAINQRMERDGELRAVAITAGNVRVLLNKDDGARGWERTKGEGFSFTINIDQDIDAVARGIVERGGKLQSEPADMPWGARVFRLVDPDGYRFAISSPLR